MCDKMNDCPLQKHLFQIITLNGICEEDKGKMQAFIENNCNSLSKISAECEYAAIRCCPKFPDCGIVILKNKESVIRGTDAVWILAMETCTNLNTGQCQRMLAVDARLIIEGKGQEITMAKELQEKFKNLENL